MRERGQCRHAVHHYAVPQPITIPRLWCVPCKVDAIPQSVWMRARTWWGTVECPQCGRKWAIPCEDSGDDMTGRLDRLSEESC